MALVDGAEVLFTDPDQVFSSAAPHLAATFPLRKVQLALPDHPTQTIPSLPVHFRDAEAPLVLPRGRSERGRPVSLSGIACRIARETASSPHHGFPALIPLCRCCHPVLARFPEEEALEELSLDERKEYRAYEWLCAAPLAHTFFFRCSNLAEYRTRVKPRLLLWWRGQLELEHEWMILYFVDSNTAGPAHSTHRDAEMVLRQLREDFHSRSIDDRACIVRAPQLMGSRSLLPCPTCCPCPCCPPFVPLVPSVRCFACSRSELSAWRVRSRFTLVPVRRYRCRCRRLRAGHGAALRRRLVSRR